MTENKSMADELLAVAPYSDSEEQKKLFIGALQEELCFHYDNNEMYRRFCQRKGFDPHQSIARLEDIPAVSVSVFKELGFGLNSVSKEDLTMALQSSATSGVPSTIVLDKVTSKRQGKAMVKVISEFIGNKRLPFLIMDIDPQGASRQLLGARFAAVTGYLKFASQVGFFLKADAKGISYFDIDAIKEYLAGLKDGQPVVLFGFTYILFQNVLKAIEASDETIRLPEGSKIIHIGGWKKLESEKISKELFNQRLSQAFGIKPEDVIDIYGFTEQMGLNYPDCQCGCKHASSYVDVIVRDPVTRQPVEAGKEGMLEFITPIPHSYPGNAVVTDDLGIIEPGECPYGRSGKRFKIVGRMKKAEVRGCGDILSAKLTFSSKVKDAVKAEESLDVQYSAHDLSASTPVEKIEEIIAKLRDNHDWLRRQPIEAIIGLIGRVAKKWLANPEFQFLKDKGLLFLSQWCSCKHLAQVAEVGLRGNLHFMDSFAPFPNSEKHLLKATSRGLACHWLAGNVQILGMFALVQCILTKNVNLLKVANTDNGVFKALIKSFEGEEYTTPDGWTIKGDDLVKTIAVVYFPRNAKEVAVKMSKVADVRIAWGGREAVETVASYPSKIDCQTVIFGPKLSFAVIAKEELEDEQDVKKLARRLSVDVSVFDQAGCASPHHLYIEKGGKITPTEFCQTLADVFPKTEVQIPKPSISPEQVSAIHSARGVYDFKGKVWGSESMSWTILLSDEEPTTWSKPVYSRVIMVHEVNDIDDSLNVIEDFTQSIGIAAPLDRAKAYAIKATEKGVSRLPKIGRMLNFEMPWDGMFLIDHLVKWNTLLGPLC